MTFFIIKHDIIIVTAKQVFFKSSRNMIYFIVLDDLLDEK